MPRFGPRSSRELATIHPDLQRVLREVIQYIDFVILQGLRGKADQQRAYRDGKTKKPWPLSAHNVPAKVVGVDPRDWVEDPTGMSRAVDIAPYPIDWGDHRQFALLAGQVLASGRALGVNLRWGGDWDRDGHGNWRDPDNTFNDLVHFELFTDSPDS